MNILSSYFPISFHADTFENAIIELAKLVKEYYGDEYIWNDDDEPKF